jgi:hypothetical protein
MSAAASFPKGQYRSNAIWAPVTAGLFYGDEAMPNRSRKVVRRNEALAKIPTRKVLATERKFPHIVEIVLPVHGLDIRVNRGMVTFCHMRNIRPRFGRRRKRTGQYTCRWCFSDKAIADAFREQFGGVRV